MNPSIHQSINQSISQSKRILLPPRAQVQGGILNFEVLSPSGTPLSYRTFEREAAEEGFHVRTGAECNPGACYAYLGVL